MLVGVVVGVVEGLKEYARLHNAEHSSKRRLPSIIAGQTRVIIAASSPHRVEGGGTVLSSV